MKELFFIGMNPTGPNTSACLLSNKNGLISFVEEERFTRKKLASNVIPTRSIKYCLEHSNLQIEDITAISVGWDHIKYPKFMKNFYNHNMSHKKKDFYSKNIEEIKLIEMTPQFLKERIKISFYRAGLGNYVPIINFYQHHLSHVASVYYHQNLEALTFVIDGSGEELGTSIWKCNINK